MKEIIDTIIKENKNLFSDSNKIERINIGFTNTIYNINDTYIIKICTDKNNEDKIKYTDIPRIIEMKLNNYKKIKISTIEDILELDNKVKKRYT